MEIDSITFNNTVNYPITLPFRVNKNSSYTPLFSIGQRDPLLNYHFNMLKDINLDRNISFYITRYAKHYKLDPIIGLYKQVNNPIINNFSYNLNIRSESYKRMFKNLYDNLIKIGVNLYISNNQSVIHYNPISKVYTPLWMMVVKNEYVKYVRQCLILNRPIHNDCLKLLVNEDLDVTRGQFNLIRPSYRKYIKKVFIEQGLTIETVTNFDEVLTRIELPKASSINGYLSKLSEISSDFISSVKENEKHEVTF